MSAIIQSFSDRLRGAAGRQHEDTVQIVDEVAGDPGDADARLVALFRNRAELKKAFTRLRAECHDLRERLAAAEQEPNQSNGRLAALEQRLSERETAYPALVYYQLRGLWRFCHNMLLEFAEQLKEQHHAREYAAHEAAWRRQQSAELARMDQRLELARLELRRCESALGEQQVALEALTGFWNHFRRRRAREELEVQELRAGQARSRFQQQQRERETLAAEEAPPFEGLSVEARRNVNLAVLAFAQYLYIQFSPSSLSQLSLAAMSRSLSEVSYGTRRDCESLMELIEKAIARMAEKRGYGDELKLRARHLKRRVTFASDAATLPESASLGNFPLEFHDGFAGVQVDVNVLEENFWFVDEVLLD